MACADGGAGGGGDVEAGLSVQVPTAVVSVSGGKDSTATALVAIETYGRARVRLVMADTGHEHPLTMAYVQDYLPGALGLPIEIVRADFTSDFARKRAYIVDKWPGKGVPVEVINRALAVLHPTGVPFLDLCMWKGRFPSRKAQFCTEFLKRNPLDRFTIDLARSGQTVESWQGVRRDESPSRKDALERERSDWGWDIVRPLVTWTADEVFSYADRRGVAPNPLYRLGMKRVGCMPCINCGKDELREIAARWPAEIERVREWESIVADCSKRGIATLFFQINTKGGTDAEYAAANGIDARVDWSRTSRGGTQFDIVRFMPATECSSVYGLCE